MSTKGDCRALEELHTVVESLSPHYGKSRRDQLHWVEAEMTRAVRLDVLPRRCCRSLTDLMQPETLATYLDAGAADELRERARVQGRPGSGNSQRIRRGILRMIAQAAGMAVLLPPPPLPTALADPVADRQQHALWRFVNDSAVSTYRTVSRYIAVRMAAEVAVTLDTGCRFGELIAMRMEDFGPGLESVLLHRRPQRGGRHDEVVPLSRNGRAAVARWLALRKKLMDANLSGGTHPYVWTTVRGGGVHPVGRGRKPAGLPITVTGLRQQYQNAVCRLNEEMRHVPGWVPLPGTHEQLRRGSKWHRHTSAPSAPTPQDAALNAA